MICYISYFLYFSTLVKIHAVSFFPISLVNTFYISCIMFTGQSCYKYTFLASGNHAPSWSSKECILEDTHGRLRFYDKIHCRSKIKGLPLDSQCHISVCPTMEKSNLFFIKPITKAKGQKFCAIDSVLVQPRLSCPH